MMARGRRALPLLLLGAGTAAAACTDVPSGPGTPFSIAFERLPFPAVVLGDLLRDTLGAVAPLAAVVYDGSGDLMADAAVEYVVVGGAATLQPGNLMRGDSLGGEVRITAYAGELPSLPRTLVVVRRPDTLAAPEAAPAPLEWVPLPAPAGLARSDTLAVRVLSQRPDSAPAAVPSWVVRYELFVNGTTAVALGDTSLVWVVDDNGRASAVDTTDAEGRATRRVRARGDAPGIAGVDSVVLFVTALGTEAPLPGSPVRIVLPVRSRE